MAKRSKDNPSSVATNALAPADERYDATVAVHKTGLADLIPPSELSPVIDYIQGRMADEDMMKARANIIPFPSPNKGKPGMQSVYLDEFQVTAQGHYWDRPGLLGFDSMRSMVDATPILNSIILTRIRQVMRFCHPQMNTSGAGFAISHVDKNIELDETQQRSVQLMQHFMVNCGWETDPRKRKRLKRDTFSQFMGKLVRDSLTLDAAPIETEWKRDQSLGIDGLYAVDGGTIRLCTEEGYDGDDEIFALQVIQGRIRTAYSYEDLIYEVRNPRTDVTASGYGLSETEMLIKIVTYMLNTMTYNGSFFDKNSIPRGILHLSGQYDSNDISAFKRYWNSMVRGATNAHNMPVLVSKDQESKAEFAEIGGQMSEMAFGKWLTFLTSVSCAVYGISPEEIAMESFAAQKSGLSGSDTEERITSSNDKGLRPLLGHFENVISDFVIQTFSPNYMFRFVGLDQEDEKSRFEMRKMVITLNEGRQLDGRDPIEGPLGDAPLNPALLSVWQQMQGVGQQPEEEEDYGQPPDDDQGGQPPEEGDQDPGAGEDDQGDGPGAEDPPDFGKPAGDKDFGKAFGLPDLYVYGVES